ncbi:MAG TPA: hypothetical protein PKV98_07725 [Burkholderiaceae bacterium]|nr:hypothetical protein [Burkholderiaceae bacterium]
MWSGAQSWTRILAVALAGFGLAACGGGDDPPPPAAAPAADLVGAAGGTVKGEGGVTVLVPAEALTSPVTIRVARDSNGAPLLAADSKLASPVYALTPHGIGFERPAVVRIPFDSSTAPGTDYRPVLMKAAPGGSWTVLAGAERDGDALVADADSFSYYVVKWCRHDLAAGTENGFQSCALAQGDVSLGIVSPLPPTPPARSRLGAGAVLQPAAPALLITRPSLLVMRVTVEALYGTNTPDHDVYFEVRTGPGQVVANGSFPSAELRNAPHRKTVDVGVPLTEQDQGLRSYRVEVFCKDTTGIGCTGLLVGGVRPFGGDLLGAVPELPAYRAASNSVLVRVAIPIGAQPDPASRPVLDLAQSGFIRPAADGGGYVDTWQSTLSGGSRIPLVATTVQPANHTWQISTDGGTTWTDWLSAANPAVAATYPNVTQSSRTICVSSPAVACPAGAWPQYSTAQINGLQFRVIATNAFGGVGGPPWSISAAQVRVAPTVASGPQSIRVVAGQTASFTVVASGVPAPTYQWQRRTPANLTWQDVTGAVAATYTTPVLQALDSGASYRVRVANSEGSATSDTAFVLVDEGAIAPFVTSQPLNLTVGAGSEAVFAVVADGTSPLSYQWRRNGVDITGANAPMLKLPATAPADAGSYSVAITNPVGSVTSAAATLTVNASGPPAPVAPTIVTPPASATVNAGNAASFAVAVTGTGPLTYQWRRNGTAIGGATGAVYTIAAVAAADVGAYTVVVTNSAGSATSPAANLTVNPAPSPVVPTISSQPSGLVVIPGATATFAVAVTGTAPLMYQWQRNGSALPGATGPVLTLTNVNGADAGNYSVFVSNAVGSVTSANAPLILIGAPAITTQPLASAVAQGLPASFAVTATGDALQYQWLRNNVAIPGATSAVYTTPPTQASDNGVVYSVIVYNNAGLVISSGALLTVAAPVTPPVITVQPVDATINDGDFATIVADVGGSRPLFFQLQRLSGATWNDVGSASSTSSSLPIAVQTPTMTVAESGAQFRVVFSNTAGNVATRAVTVTVNAAVPANALKATSVTAGYRNSFVVATDGTVWAWGEAVDAVTGQYNGSGILSQWATRPVQVQGLANVLKVATFRSGGAYGSYYALHSDGSVSAWGGNQYGQLGTGTVEVDRVAPVKVMDGALPFDKACDITVGRDMVVLIRSDEADGSCAAGKAKRAWIAGLFNGSVVGGLAVPSAALPSNGGIIRPVPGVPAGVPVARVRAIDAQSTNNALLIFLEDGRIYAWGWNYDNMVGAGTSRVNVGIVPPSDVLPVDVTAFWGDAVWAEMGFNFTISRHADGTLRGVGRNAKGQLADSGPAFSRTTLQVIAAPPTLAAMPEGLSVGFEAVIAIEGATGALWGWGDAYGLIKSLPGESVTAPLRIGTGTGFSAVSAGARHALAIGPGGVVHVWGFRESGALGDGSSTGYSLTPTMVTR